MKPKMNPKVLATGLFNVADDSNMLEKVKDEYVDEVDQADVMDSAINGVLQSLDPYSAYMLSLIHI